MAKVFLVSLLFFTNLFAKDIYATFDVQAKQSADLAFSAGGIIDNIKVDIGSKVKKGDVLASLKNDDLKALLKTYETSLKYAKIDLDRQTKVKNIIDQEKYDTYEYKYENAKNQKEYQEALLDKTYLKAPFDGIITSKELEVGDVVSGQMIKTVFTIQTPKMRKLVLKFDQKYHQEVKVGDIFTYRLDGDIKEYQGTISKIYPTVDSDSRKILAEVEAQNIPVGLFGDGYIKAK